MAVPQHTCADLSIPTKFALNFLGRSDFGPNRFMSQIAAGDTVDTTVLVGTAVRIDPLLATDKSFVGYA